LVETVDGRVRMTRAGRILADRVAFEAAAALPDPMP